jgi:hypothetical protein
VKDLTTFGPSIPNPFPMNDGSACTAVFWDGDAIGDIEKVMYDAGSTSIEYRTEGYNVVLYSPDPEEAYGTDEWFFVEDYGTARKALAAAKAWTRKTVKTFNREVR